MKRGMVLFSLSLILYPLLVAHSAGPDLARIDRTIAKEPRYQSNSPKYCLLTFGPDAKTRIWLVLDGDLLFVDRNGNGDLTEEGEKVRGIPCRLGEFDITLFKVERLPAVKGKKLGFELRLFHRNDHYDWLDLYEDYEAGETVFGSRGKRIQLVTADDHGNFRFAPKPQDAPLVHFLGPLRIALATDLTFSRDAPEDLRIMLGTPGLGPGTYAPVDCESVPPEVHPVAEIEFPNRKPGGPAITMKLVLNKRC